MNNTLKTSLPGMVLLLAQAPVAWAVWVAAGIAKFMWIQALGRGAVLPFATRTATDFGVVIPVAAALICVVLLCMDWRKESPRYFILFAVAICEVVALALFAQALLLPALSITWGIER